MTLATSPGYLHYPPPTVYLADAHHGGCLCLGDELPLLSLPALIWPSFARDVVSIPQQQTDGGSPIEPNGSSPMPEETRTDSFMGDMDNEAPQFAMDNAETAEVQTVERNDSIPPFGDQLCWEVPFLHGCEMGAHFSPCGRFLAARVACMLPHLEADPGFQGHVLHDNAGAATSLAHQVMETTVPIYTILEVYRVSGMELVRVLPSAEDEVKVACFHPSVGGGLVYGTKEGKLRILQYDTSHATNCLGKHMLEVPTHVLEC
ncbi:hypothetical protein GH714_005589 [Hevea brasiliensis]|uniref:Uncharacterized protein n=1 Tax=Hevea brasiliensis TaxID=3981 RepID=A0A6A6KBT6_HEVBR|nr:hypothetical protein GH714_005589 [Hevea brasiliensis]